MADVQLTALQVKAAPLDYVVPASAVIRLKSVRAEFTDNGAGADWLPAVQLISDSGHIIATASDQAATVTAGDDADASFFPGVKPAAAAAATASLPCAFVDRTNTLTLSTWGSVYTAVTWELLQPPGSDTFAWPGSGGNNTVALLRSGVYRCVYEYQVSGASFPAGPGVILSQVSTSVAGALTETLSLNATTGTLFRGDPSVGTPWGPPGERVFNLQAPADLSLLMAWTGAGSTGIATVVMFLYRLGDSVF